MENAEVVYGYSRAQAIEDGDLVDLTPIMKEKEMMAFKWPTACSKAVWETCIAWDEKDGTQDIAGRLWDVLTTAVHAIKTNHDPSASFIYFPVMVRGADDKVTDQYLKISCGPGDTPEPVMTILMENEN